MANAARVHTVENGRDIAQFTMVAFGGGAPLHACRLCEKLGLKEALIPPGAGVGSAIGFLQAPVSFEATRGLYQRLDTFDGRDRQRDDRGTGGGRERLRGPWARRGRRGSPG